MKAQNQAKEIKNKDKAIEKRAKALRDNLIRRKKKPKKEEKNSN